jgi:hypothetical protein
VSIPADTTTTDLGTPTKIFGDRRAELPPRDLTDPDQVFALALEVVKANPRRLLQVTVAETRAIAVFAARAGAVTSAFLNVVELSDANAPKPTLKAALAEAADTARRVFPAAPKPKGQT